MTTETLEPNLVVRTESTGSDALRGTERVAVNAVRFLAAHMVDNVGSGHPVTTQTRGDATI